MRYGGAITSVPGAESDGRITAGGGALADMTADYRAAEQRRSGAPATGGKSFRCAGTAIGLPTVITFSADRTTPRATICAAAEAIRMRWFASRLRLPQLATLLCLMTARCHQRTDSSGWRRLRAVRQPLMVRTRRLPRGRPPVFQRAGAGGRAAILRKLLPEGDPR
ncbi:hypothetical protein KCP73_01660 [Salmonella enterica subsp. enterica]|nr:hypothetical protein KCP73_01660 [Salmonella enterica subsp. enterica]